MNEIDFVIEDIENLALSLDFMTKEVYPPLIDLEVNPSNEKQEFEHENAYGYDKVVVNAVNLQDKTITPKTQNQVINSDSGYTGLNEVTVEAVTNEIDENITSENIKSGVSILGVEGELKDKQLGSKNITVNGVYNASDDNLDGYDTVTVETSGDAELEESFLAMIDTTSGKNITKLPKGITSIRNYAFYYSTNIEIIELPETVTSIGSYAFQNSGLSEITIPFSVTSIGSVAFRNSKSLIKVDNYSNARFSSYTFTSCSNLATLIMRATTPPDLMNTDLAGTKIASGTGYIYVPDESIDLYKSATNWSTYASQIKGISELPA